MQAGHQFAFVNAPALVIAADHLSRRLFHTGPFRFKPKSRRTPTTVCSPLL
jgi:hypothetical protein